MADTTRPASRQPPWETGAGSEPLSFGTWLRRQREIREIPLREIAEVTKISVRYLEALEQDRFELLPAPVFAKGFLREYARYVGLDADEVVNSYLLAQGVSEESEAVEVLARSAETTTGEWSSGLFLALGVVALLALVVSLVFYSEWSRSRREVEPPSIAAPPITAVPEPAAPLPEPASEPAAEPAAAAPLLVTMDFREDCWVEAEVDGDRRISELHVQGESMRIEANELVLLTLGNPEGVHIEVNGRTFEPEVRPGRVARDLRIDLETAQQLLQVTG